MKLIEIAGIYILMNLTSLLAVDSIKANYGGYLAIAQAAADDPSIFEQFRTFGDYCNCS